ncbi:MAG: hypothetical protein K9N46_10905 [Candidatus Marinimicrobia bacterium]|nr:hypothetical protein [Candidatus Neomarinimicrobiota bacterium]MCF7827710.1 hypothetical protein [Candidatus Neomarinimicrobiota bacterium]MCF7881235.1 hypothetical protein [Candidatus Neomarinimicrobiota bacterium]
MAYEIESKQHWGLNLLIVLLVGVLFAVLMIPKQIWEEEEQYRQESRQNMQNLWKVENVFFDLTDSYTEIGENAITVVNAVYDSLQDSVEFYGNQSLTVPPKSFTLNVERNAIVEWIDSTLADTTYQAYWQELVEYVNNVAVDDSTNSGQFAHMLLSAAYDSVKADTTWSGQQTVTIPFTYDLFVGRDYAGAYDTTFVTSKRTETTVFDTSFHAIISADEEDTTALDTLWFPKRDLSDMQFRYENIRFIDTSITRETRWITETIQNRPTKEWLYGPLTGKPYEIRITGGDVQHLRITSPIEGEYRERRYVVFAFSDTSHGFIEDGEVSWEEE